MQTFRAEFMSDYSTYSFGYCEYAEREEGEAVGPIYAEGFLPYSGDTRVQEDIFYRARSLRVDLKRLRFDKKRRYHQRTVDKLDVDFSVYEKAEFLRRAGKRFRKDAFAWIEQRFEQCYLNDARLDYVLEKPYLNTVLSVNIAGQPAAYALLCRWEDAFHFWYSFYDSERYPHCSLGKWLMGRSLQWGRDEGMAYGYLGTGYGLSSAYKGQGIDGVSFHDGNEWIEDRDRLAYLRQRDMLSPSLKMDLFKEGAIAAQRE